MVKLGIKRLKAKLWLKLWLTIPKRILLTRFNIHFIIGLNAFFRNLFKYKYVNIPLFAYRIRDVILESIHNTQEI
jgi:hypothetical protein